jgi:hypothetical protein
VLKKAGIVVAAAAAGLLAVSPLAFAGESHGKSWGHGETNTIEQNSEGLINVSDINANVPVNALNCNEVDLGLIPVDADPITAPLAGALALFGEADVDQKTFVDNSCSTDQGASTAGDTTSIDD